MNLENQVCSLELAKKLKELGVKQESYFSWFRENKDHTYEKWTNQGDVEFQLMGSHHANITSDKNSGRWESIVSAFTVAELGEMLKPHNFITYRIYDNGDGIMLQFENIELNKKKGDDFFADTEADARAKMLIYLLENKFIITP